jgi:nucleotide-binding universal stress UspA family protein
MVGVDGSPSSLAALGWAAQQAEFTGATLEVLGSWEWPITYGASVALPEDYDPAADTRRELDDAIASGRAAHPNVVFRATVVEGHPAPSLVEASKGAELLVVGSRGHGAFAGMLLGSVSEHCVANAFCPVLVMRGD